MDSIDEVGLESGSLSYPPRIMNREQIRTIGGGLLVTYYVTTVSLAVLGMTAFGLALSTGDPQALWPCLMGLGGGLYLVIRILFFEFYSIMVGDGDQLAFRALLRTRCVSVDKITNIQRLQIYGIGGVRLIKLSFYDAESKNHHKIRLLTTSEKSQELGLGRFGYTNAKLKRTKFRDPSSKSKNDLSIERFLNTMR